ncbi:copper amine oxidase N-terminal domain-containing protein [Lysinibacillus sp. BW-2-10]|uniref:copper amine oxidase N-terminal domain-containing protein n=1 Tax=Lysinibacillus sp. BW-2-10 TaxID=2590030 RepID=UPI00117CE3F8|nr:copper amine oxidase N-terminal domain-containing protein [Lysinibacillus sp. BW-2-10]TSI04740.1 copper amine oxidase N-terminal domain-containing protein [Lysinibacillus sp. BW-2-10]
MDFKKIALSATTLLLVGTLSNGLLVKADDDEDDDEHKFHEEYHDDDDKYEYEDDDEEYEYEYEEDDEYEYDNYTDPTVSTQDTWNIWTRTMMVQKGELPFNESKNVTLTVENENNPLSFYVIPRDREFFVPGKAVAETLGAKATVYNTSKILEVTTDNTEMILRADKNVAYDNNLKTPLPSVAFYMNNDIYIPISVITNALGYSVEWQAENNTFICRPLTSN